MSGIGRSRGWKANGRLHNRPDGWKPRVQRTVSRETGVKRVEGVIGGAFPKLGKPAAEALVSTHSGVFAVGRWETPKGTQTRVCAVGRRGTLKQVSGKTAQSVRAQAKGFL